MNKPMNELIIENKKIGKQYPTYFIADIAANHDGDLERAKDLIYLAKEAGADAAKFQHFKAESIVSDFGFKSLGNQKSHQLNWEKTVFEVYKDASVDIGWTAEIKNTCIKAGITFFTSPYDFELVDYIDSYVPAYKIGSGDITWIDIIKKIASKGKPYILATGASTMQEVHNAVSAGLEVNPQLALLQCNTNYTGSIENMKYINLNVLNTYRSMYPEIILGLSDHTPGHAAVLGAVALGARLIEKHFTDDLTRIGPDHAFSLNPTDWRDMVIRTRELEAAMGGGIKVVEKNEEDTVVLQRRSIRLSKAVSRGDIITFEDLIMLRPCPHDAIPPNNLHEVIGKKLTRNINKGEHLKWSDLT